MGGTVQEFDFDSDETDHEDSEVNSQSNRKRSRQKRLSSSSSSLSDSLDEDVGPVTVENMEARSRALDAKAQVEAEEDLQELQRFATQEDEDDLIADEVADENGDIDVQPFHLPTVPEREAEKQSGGADVHVVQRRIRECVRVLGKFSKLAEENR